MPTRCLIGLILMAAWPLSSLRGEELRLRMVDGMPQGVTSIIAKQLVPRHARIRIGDQHEFCEIWITKSWKTGGEGRQPGDSDAPIEYPLKQGSLVGVIQLRRACVDLRDEEIPAGVYTLRYAVQPASTDHAGSHDSRDFLLLLSPHDDKSPAPIPERERLYSLSVAARATAGQGEHPGFLPLLKPARSDRKLSVRRDDADPDSWLLFINGKDETGKKIPMEMILPYWTEPSEKRL